MGVRNPIHSGSSRPDRRTASTPTSISTTGSSTLPPSNRTPRVGAGPTSRGVGPRRRGPTSTYARDRPSGAARRGISFSPSGGPETRATTRSCVSTPYRPGPGSTPRSPSGTKNTVPSGTFAEGDVLSLPLGLSTK